MSADGGAREGGTADGRSGGERDGEGGATVTGDAPRPLDGVRVLEMGQLIAGPFAGQLLAAFGAEVVKIEPPGRGDPLRRWRVLDDSGTSYWWASIARGKKSVTLDLGHEEGRAVARSLIERADVVLENFRPGRMEAWGLGPDAFAVTNPALVYTRVSGYGQDGPYAARPGFASACEAEAGMRHVNGHPGEAPVRANLSLGDTFAGLHAVIGTLLALIARGTGGASGGASRREAARPGAGQVVDVSILESVFQMLEGVLPEYDGAGIVREPSGTTVTGIVPTGTYRARDDRFVVIGGNGDSIFRRLMRAAGRDDLADDPALADNAGRVAREGEIDAALAAWCATLDAPALLEALAAADVPSGPINSIADIARDPHFLARGNLERVTVRGQARRMPAVHPKLAATPARTDAPGPDLGAHTDAVLADWLGADAATLARWREAGCL